MSAKMRRNLPGSFLTCNLGTGGWRLSRSRPSPIDVLLRGAESAAAEILSQPSVDDIDIEWHAEAIVLTVTSAQRRRSLKAQSALVHEPLPRLYDALPLVTMDEKARRFWRKVFRLVRIPGGRHLLGVLARRHRN
jgi:hypothetical protein